MPTKFFWPFSFNCDSVDLSCTYSVLGAYDIAVMWQIAIVGASCNFTSEI